TSVFGGVQRISSNFGRDVRLVGGAAPLVFGVPEQDPPVGAGRDQGIAVGAEVEPPDPVAVAPQDEELVAGGGVRDPDGPVPARGGPAPAIGAERHPLDEARPDAI